MLIETVAVEWVRLQELEKDAARYRWLRDKSEWDFVWNTLLMTNVGPKWDKAIDKAMEVENATTR